MTVDFSWWAGGAIDGYRDLLTLIGSVSGVVLALYFTALTTVMQASYRDVAESVRQVLLRDTHGNTYVSLLTTTIGAALVFILALAIGWPATRLHVVVGTIVGLVALYSFAGLGRHAFNFFDPTKLLQTIVADFLRLARGASTSGFEWNTPEYQQYYRRRAEDLLETAQRILELAQREPLTKTPVADLSALLVAMLSDYEAITPRIPRQSHWYPRVWTQARWYDAPVERLELGLISRGSLPADAAPDNWWVERRILRMIAGALESALDAQALDSAIALAGMVARACFALGQSWHAHEALDWLGPVAQRVGERLASPATVPDAQRALVGLAEATAAAQLAALAGLREGVRSFDLSRLAQLVEDPSWHEGVRPFATALPPEVLGGLEELRASIAFELASESVRRTPGWFLLERMSLLLTRIGQDQFEALFAPAEAEPSGAIPNTPNGARIRAAFLSSQLSYCHYLRLFASEFGSRRLELIAKHRSGDLEWPVWSDEGVQRRIRQAEQRCVERFLRVSLLLSEADRDSAIPDYLGQIITRAGRECMNALLQDDHEYFRSLFPLFLVAAVQGTEQLLAELPQGDPVRRLHLAAGPIIDAVEISGYALVHDELTRNFACWPDVRRLWRRLIEGESGQRLVLLIAAAHGIAMEPLRGLTPRALLRAGWQQALDARLRSLPRQQPRDWFGEGQVDHPSLLIRVLARNPLFGSFHHGSEIFVECFLRRQPGASAVDFGDRGHLRDTIDSTRRRERGR